jgi:hypothetical protein
MEKFYLDPKSLSNGLFSVHRDGCPFLPESNKRIYLGKFDFPEDAVTSAKIICLNSDGCNFCLREYSVGSKMKQRDWRVPLDLKIAYSEN